MLVFGKNTTIMTKQLHSVIDSRKGWVTRVEINPEALEELKFWAFNADHMNIRNFVYPTQPLQIVVFSDTSSVGCGSYISINVVPMAHRNFTEIEMKQSSTWRELVSVKFALQNFLHQIINAHVKLYTDNKAVSFIVDSGSNKAHLNNITKEIFFFRKAE